MCMKATGLAALVLGMVIAASPFAAQAASLPGPGSKVQVSGLAQVARMRHHHHRHHARSRGPGRCGENRYWSAKRGHCVDARNRA